MILRQCQVTMAQSATRKSHNLKIASSILTCGMFYISDWDTLQTQPGRNCNKMILRYCQAKMAQPAARESHNLKVVSSILTCLLMFCTSDSEKLQSQLNYHFEIVSRWFSDKDKRHWRSRQRVIPIILRSWVQSSLVAFFEFLIQTSYQHNWITRSQL